MKPFNLEAAKKGETIMFSDGNYCEFGAHISKARYDQQVVVLDMEGCIWRCDEHGNRPGYDLNVVMSPQKQIVWIVLCAPLDFGGSVISGVLANESAAQMWAAKKELMGHHILDVFPHEVEK